MLQDGLAQALGALEVGVHLGLGFAQDGKAALDFGDDAVLFGLWRNGQSNRPNFAQ